MVNGQWVGFFGKADSFTSQWLVRATRRLAVTFSVLLLLTVLSVLSVRAHVVNQFFVDVDEDRRRLVVQFDVGYAMPETRDDPYTLQPDREWLIEQIDSKHLVLRQEAERYLRSGVEFRVGQEAIEYEVFFPDFKESPYAFPKLLNGGAYYRVELIPERWDKGVMVSVIKREAFPKLMLAFDRDGSGDAEEFVMLGSGMGTAFTELEAVGSFGLLELGFRHVIPDGLDHVLFILGMCCMAGSLKLLLWQSLTFTVAHSVTMGLVVSKLLPIYEWPLAQWVEPVIALSIVLIAAETFYAKRQTGRKFALVAILGAVHGMGFAGSLGSALGLVSEGSWLMNLLIANVGVEFAQVILLIVGYVLLLNIDKRVSEKNAGRTRLMFATMIGAMGLSMFLARVIA